MVSTVSHPLLDSPNARDEVLRSPLPSTCCVLAERSAPVGQVSCDECWLGRVCMRHGASATDMDWLHLDTAKRRVNRGVAVYRNGDCFHAIFSVRSGLCKSTAVCSTGQEKITGFHLPGELFGLSGITTGRYGYDAIAVEDSEICIIPYPQLLKLSLRNTELQWTLFKLVSAAIRQDQGLLERLESLLAEERIIAWLLNLSERYGRCGYSAERFPFAMSRREAANYLGLAHETVSRLLSRLRNARLICVTEKDIEIKDRDALLERSGGYQPT